MGAGFRNTPRYYTDTERLDWLTKNKCGVWRGFDMYHCIDYSGKAYGNGGITPRQAIESAMRLDSRYRRNNATIER